MEKHSKKDIYSFELYSSQPLIAGILKRLEEELPKAYTYHNITHSLDVMKECLELAKCDKLSQQEVALLMIAAAFHDAGYLTDRNEHEIKGVELFIEEMNKDAKQHGISQAQANEIKQAILSTKTHKTDTSYIQKPLNQIGKYLADADVSNFGRKNFFDIARLIITENKADDADFYLKTLSLIKDHRWHTNAGLALYEEQKQKNISSLESMITDK